MPIITKKNKISLETSFWAGREIENPCELICDFFDYCTVDSYKNTLSEIILYINQTEVCRKNHPGNIFDLHTAVKKFIRASYLLVSKAKQYKVKKAPKQWSTICQASLSSKEYQNPFLVFEKAFKCKTSQDYEFFLNEIVHVSLFPFKEEFDYDLISPHIHLVKMLDAAQIISERGVKKIKK